MRRAFALILRLFASAFVFGTLAISAQTFTFNNAASIAVGPGAGAGTPYPSNITVSGFAGQVARITVTLNDVNHQRPDDLGVLLVGPGGQKVRLMTDVGGNTAVASNIDITLDDRAASVLPDSAVLTTGTFKPTLGTNVLLGEGVAHPANFPVPAPAAPYSVLLSDFIGTAPNGTWSLYADDDTLLNSGTIAGGWTLNITIGRVFTNSAAITIPDTGTGTPYPSTINVAGVGVVTKITVRINNLSHTWPEDVGLLLVGPAGALGPKVRLMTDAAGGTGAEAFTNAFITFDDAAANLLPDNTTPAPSTFRPTLGDDSPAGGSAPHPANFPAPAPVAPYVLTLSSFNGINPNGNWSLYVNDDTAGDSGTIAGGWTLVIEAITLSSAGADVSGQVVSASGRGISGVMLDLTGGPLTEPRYVRTNPFGYYTFAGVPTGHAYVVTVSSKRYLFANPSQVITVDDNIEGLDFIAEPLK
jgi:subtilisin-like proprotein convertase family protein